MSEHPSPEQRIARAFAVYLDALRSSSSLSEARQATITVARVCASASRDAIRLDPATWPRGHPSTHRLLSLILAIEDRLEAMDDPLLVARETALDALGRVELAIASGNSGGSLATRLAALHHASEEYREAVRRAELQRRVRDGGALDGTPAGQRSDDPATWELVEDRGELARIVAGYQDGLRAAEEVEMAKKRVRWDRLTGATTSSHVGVDKRQTL